MATARLRPTSRIGSATWFQTATSRINDVVIDPTGGDESAIEANENDDNEGVAYRMANPSDLYTDLIETEVITSLTLKVSTKKAGAPVGTTVDLVVNGSAVGAQAVTPTTSYAYATVTFSGSWTIAQIDTLEFHSDVGAMPKDAKFFIDVAYVEFTYTPDVVATGGLTRFDLMGSIGRLPLSSQPTRFDLTGGRRETLT